MPQRVLFRMWTRQRPRPSLNSPLSSLPEKDLWWKFFLRLQIDPVGWSFRQAMQPAFQMKGACDDPFEALFLPYFSSTAICRRPKCWEKYRRLHTVLESMWRPSSWRGRSPTLLNLSLSSPTCRMVLKASDQSRKDAVQSRFESTNTSAADWGSFKKKKLQSFSLHCCKFVARIECLQLFATFSPCRQACRSSGKTFQTFSYIFRVLQKVCLHLSSPLLFPVTVYLTRCGINGGTRLREEYEIGLGHCLGRSGET